MFQNFFKRINFLGLNISEGSNTPVPDNEPIDFLGVFKVDMNTTADQFIAVEGGRKYIFNNIIMRNFKDANGNDINMNVALDGQWWDQNGRSGNQIAMTINDFKSITTKSKFMEVFPFNNLYAFSYIALTQANDIVNTMIFSLGAPQGVPCTADMYVYGYIE